MFLIPYKFVLYCCKISAKKKTLTMFFHKCVYVMWQCPLFIITNPLRTSININLLSFVSLNSFLPSCDRKTSFSIVVKSSLEVCTRKKEAWVSVLRGRIILACFNNWEPLITRRHMTTLSGLEHLVDAKSYPRRRPCARVARGYTIPT